MSKLRIGQGFDIHQLVEGRKLIVGGVEIDHAKGLGGHSDADVLTHAIMDALLGAAGLPDIGQHFPPTDPQFKDADSIALLEQVVELVNRGGFDRIINVDATIIAEQPKMNPHIPAMKKRLQSVLPNDTDINIKATTTETLGLVGRGEGIAAMAVCLLDSYD